MLHPASTASFLCSLLLISIGCGRTEVDDEDFPEIPEQISREIELMNQPKPTVWTSMCFPTDQGHLLDTNRLNVYQPTAAGTTASAMYGSTRTVKRGKHLYSSFHEGIDIACLDRDNRGRPQDRIYAVADGVVVHVNTIAGNSSYGKYVVVMHDDPMGKIYTLYAHLSDVSARKNTLVKAGDIIGVMGNTATYAIPMQRAHLHFEVGVMLNDRFEQWFRTKKLKPSHGNFNGWNLLGLDPYQFLNAVNENPVLSFEEFLTNTPPVFEVVVRSKTRPSYFDMYPSLWQDTEYSGRAFTMACSENGVPLYGRNADEAELKQLGRKKRLLLKVFEEQVGRNGRRLITVKKRGPRKIGKNGKKHLDMMLFR